MGGSHSAPRVQTPQPGTHHVTPAAVPQPDPLLQKEPQMQLSCNGVTDFRRPPGEDPTVPTFSINLGGDIVPESSRTFCVKLLKEPSMGNWRMLRRPARIENTLQLQVPGPGARTLYLPRLFSCTSFQKQQILGPSCHHTGLAPAHGCQFAGLRRDAKMHPPRPVPGWRPLRNRGSWGGGGG